MPSKYGFETNNDRRNLEGYLRERGTEIGRSIETDVQDLLSDLAQAKNWSGEVYNNADDPNIYFHPDGEGHFCSWWVKEIYEGSTTASVNIQLVYSEKFFLEVEGWGVSIDQFCILCENLCRLTGLDVDLDYETGNFTKHWSANDYGDDDDSDDYDDNYDAPEDWPDYGRN